MAQTNKQKHAIKDKNNNDLLSYIKHLKQKNEELENLLHHQQEVARLLYSSTSFRLGNAILSPLRNLRKYLLTLLKVDFKAKPKPTTPGVIQDESISEEEKNYLPISHHLKMELSLLAYHPCISIIINAKQTKKEHLKLSIESVVMQPIENMDLILLVASDQKSEITEYYHKQIDAPKNCTLKIIETNKHSIADSLNDGGFAASGEWLLFLKSGDRLALDALANWLYYIQDQAVASIIYTDDDKFGEDGIFHNTFHKPDYSPDRILNQNYIGDSIFIKKELFKYINGFSHKFEPAHCYDLLLRCAENTDSIGHIAKVMLHQNSFVHADYSDKSISSRYNKEKTAIKATLARRKVKAEVETGLASDGFRVHFELNQSGKVSILIPTNGNLTYLKPCIESLKKYKNRTAFEVVIILNNIKDLQAVPYLQNECTDIDLVILEQDVSFNFSSHINYGASFATGDYLLVYNDDVVATHDGWLDAMMEYAQQKKIGAVGAKLLYPDGSIQHAGIILGMSGTGAHVFNLSPETSEGYFNSLNVVNNFSALTGACMLIRKEVFDETNGFDSAFAIEFNDVDFCLRLRELNYRIVYTPHACLTHHESVSRGSHFATKQASELFLKEEQLFKSKWQSVLLDDPYYNPNLSLRSTVYEKKTKMNQAFEYYSILDETEYTRKESK